MLLQNMLLARISPPGQFLNSWPGGVALSHDKDEVVLSNSKKTFLHYPVHISHPHILLKK
jgi:hypothetical protein